MKKKLLIIGAVVVVGLIAFMGWYFLSPSASQSSLYKDLEKVQIQPVSVEDQSYTSGSCFDTCASAYQNVEIPETSDYPALYRDQKQKLEQNGYTVTTTQEDFVATTYSNGSPSGRYLQMYAISDNKYKMTIQFQNEAGQPSQTKPSGQSVGSVNHVVYSVTASTR